MRSRGKGGEDEIKTEGTTRIIGIDIKKQVEKQSNIRKMRQNIVSEGK